MVDRKMVVDASLGSHVCNTCGWVWATPHFTPDGKSGEQARDGAFSIHECFRFPRPNPKPEPKAPQ
jgi:hypothetical protein